MTQTGDDSAAPAKKTCFVAMPISDMSSYDAGHFTRVYQYIIKPACEKSGFIVDRADEDRKSNLIIGSVIRSIVEADLMIVDLSGRNPNVMYELGLRQAFNLPTVLIKDDKTDRIFDIQGLRDVPYESTLRIDSVQAAVSAISNAINATYKSYSDNTGDINSLIQLLSIMPAKMPDKVEISKDTSVILDALESVSARLTRLETRRTPSFRGDRVNASEASETREREVESDVYIPGVGSGTIYNLSSVSIKIRLTNGDMMLYDRETWLSLNVAVLNAHAYDLLVKFSMVSKNHKPASPEVTAGTEPA